MMAYQASIQSSTDQTPNLMMLGRNVTLPLEAVVGKPSNEAGSETEVSEYIEKRDTGDGMIT